MLLKELTEASGVSGNEKEVRDLIKSTLEGYVDHMKTDGIGNLIVYKKGSKPGGRKLMIAAHMDEVGLIVKDVDSSGLLKFMPVGGIDKRVLVSKAVKVGQQKLPGVIGAKPIHLQKRNEWSKVLDMDDLYIDIGASSKEEAEKQVSIGDYVAFDTPYMEMGNGTIKAKALDDRVGCSILIDLLKSDIDAEIYGAFTVMEEVGLVGAGPAAYQIKPDMAIVLEGTLCYEIEDLDSHEMPTLMGQGPAISLIDRTTVYDRSLRENVVRIAEENSIPYQYRKTSMGGNDSGKIHITGTGCATTGISVPTRYIHSPLSLISKSDYHNTFKLVEAIVKEFEKGAI